MQVKRMTKTLAISGASQQVNMPLTLGRINHMIFTSTASEQTCTMQLLNEDGDILYGPRDLTLPDNSLRPDLLPVGIVTVKITDPVPASGTMTIVALVEEQ